jgi:hypothetical protein
MAADHDARTRKRRPPAAIRSTDWFAIGFSLCPSSSSSYSVRRIFCASASGLGEVSRFTGAAPVMLAFEQQRGRGVRCSRLVRTVTCANCSTVRLRPLFDGMEAEALAAWTTPDGVFLPRPTAKTNPVFSPRLRESAPGAAHLPAGSPFFWVHYGFSSERKRSATGASRR